MRTRALLTAATALLTIAPAVSAVQTYQIDPSHSSVEFRIRHLVGKVPGHFGSFSATLTFDPADPTSGSVEVSIAADSIDTGNADRDKHLKSPDFFDVAKYPTITFKSTKVTSSGNRLRVDGVLTMHGVSKPVSLDAELLGTGTGFAGTPNAGFEARTTLNRKDFGIEWNRTLDAGAVILGDEVEVSITVEANVPKPTAAAN